MPMNICNLQFFNTNFIVPINEESEFVDDNFERQGEECKLVGEEASEETIEECCSQALNPTKDKCCAKDGEISDVAENCCILDSTLDSTGKCKIECPVMGVNLKAVDRNDQVLESWQECSASCSERPDCTYWSYIKDTQTDERYSKRCYTMTGYTGSSSDVHAISGVRNCGQTGTGFLWPSKS